MTIRKKILLALISFAMVPLLVSIVINMFLNVRTIEALHLNRIDKLAHISASAFGEIVNLHKSEFSLFAQNDSVSRFVEAHAKYGDDFERFESERLDLQARVEAYVGSTSVFSNLLLLDKTGIVEIAPWPEMIGLDLSDLDYFQRVIGEDDANYTFVSKVHPSLSNPQDPSQNRIALSRVLKDSKGETQGVIVALLNADILAGFSREISFGETGIAFAVDADNFILYHPEPRFYNAYTDAPKLQNLLARYYEGDIPESGAIYDATGGIDRIYYYVVIEEDDLILILRQDYSEYTQDRDRAIIVALTILVCTIIVALYFALDFSKSFVKPILRLKQSFDSGRDEGRYIVCNVETDDEIGEMAAGYNSMIQTLERQFEEINDEKTKTEHLALHDSITDMYNRTAFERILDRELKPGASYGVLFMDLDGFKQINDVMGHTFGDILLYMLGRRISNSKARFDICARIGGDEFLLYKSGTRAELEACGQILLDELRVPFDIEQHTLHVTCSIGISMYPDDGDTVDALVKNADVAMYSSKDGGKNMYSFYDKVMQSRIDRHSSIMGVLRNCIKNNEISLAYQPEVNIETGKTVAYEALMRINSEKLGPVGPGEFIAVAESDTTLISKLGRWALVTACRFARRMIDEINFKGVVAVNVSVRQLHRDDFVEEVFSVLEQENLPAEFLQIELTESVLMSDMDANVKKLSKLREKGVSIAMDDFGTHYSSFSYLIHLPLDVLKIDRSFFLGIESDDRMIYINKSIVDVAHKIGLKVIAEGVETEKQYDLVREIGCDIIQGYYFSRPLPEPEARAWCDKYQDE